MAIERFAPTVYLTRANLRSTPGPLVEKFAICVDGPDGIYRFAVGDTTADNDWTCIVPQGGRAGAWLLLDHSVAVLADLPATAAEGAKTYVRSRRSWYQYSGDAWIRTPETDPAWAQSTDVFVNYDTGSDDGAGTSDDPLATVPEAYARLGRHAVASDTYFTIYQTGNATESAWDLSAVTTTTQPITHYGVPTVLLSTTVTVGAWTPATKHLRHLDRRRIDRGLRGGKRERQRQGVPSRRRRARRAPRHASAPPRGRRRAVRTSGLPVDPRRNGAGHR